MSSGGGHDRARRHEKAATSPVASTQDWSGYIEGWRRRIAGERAELVKRHETAREDARKLATVLAKEFDVKRVYLFGSISTGRVHAHSDIDLAVEGLAPDVYFRAAARLDHETDTPVDLIDLADAPQSLIARVHREGVILYERHAE